METGSTYRGPLTDVGERVDLGLAHVLHVVVQDQAAAGQDLDALIHACSGDKSIRRGDGRDDVLDNAHRQVVVHTLDSEGVGALLRLLADPAHVLWRVLVDHLIFAELLLP